VDCATCHTPLPDSARFCLSCGTAVKPPAEALGDPLREALEAGIGFQYRIERLLGRGGMGAVYLAHELALDRPVAIKVLPPERSDPAMRERFKREARTAARLTHSGIVPLHTFGEVKGLLYFVMGFVDGESLASRLGREGRLAPDETRRILSDVADALDYAHRQGVVHRDVKPDNVLLERGTGRAVLADFGIARAAQSGGSLTGTGHLVGTPHYMSPEQASGRAEVDARSDLYSLGVMGYAMLAGRLPFDGATPGEVLAKHITQEPAPLAAVPGTPEPLVTAITRCLAKEPANRWADGASLRRALAATDSEPAEREQEVEAMRLGALLILAALPVGAWGASLWAAAPRWDLWRIGVPLACALAGLGALLASSAAVELRRRTKRPWRAMLGALLEQPEWWNAWYPRAHRRPGDVWHRLPWPIRLSRNVTMLTAAWFFLLSVPLPLMVLAAQVHDASAGVRSSFGMLLERPPVGRLVGVVFVLPFVALVGLTAEALVYGRRLTRTLGPKLADPRHAARARAAPSWKRSFWEKPPFDSLLLRETRATSPDGASRSSPTEPTAPAPEPETRTHTTDRPAREP
jgi:predicted Ser/Thr protein kinase